GVAVPARQQLPDSFAGVMEARCWRGGSTFPALSAEGHALPAALAWERRRIWGFGDEAPGAGGVGGARSPPDKTSGRGAQHPLTLLMPGLRPRTALRSKKAHAILLRNRLKSNR